MPAPRPASLNQHAMAVRHQLAYGRRNKANPILVILNFLRHTDEQATLHPLQQKILLRPVAKNVLRKLRHIGPALLEYARMRS
jgi:hypothetical protein